MTDFDLRIDLVWYEVNACSHPLESTPLSKGKRLPAETAIR